AGPQRDALLLRYLDLTEVMPQAFALDTDRRQREAAILQALLLQVPGMKKFTIDKLYAAGITTLEAMGMAKAGDLVDAAGIEHDVAHAVVERFRAYRDEVRAASPEASRKPERDKLAELAARLRAEHEAHERVAQAWTRDAEERKKDLRKA